MSVRFIVGRAGAGKTHHCLASIRKRLCEDPADGPRLIFLVPEQAGLQMERALLDTAQEVTTNDLILASHRAEVVSFRRLAFRVLEAVGISVGVALTEPARAMVLRHLAIKHANDLRYYGRLAHSGRGGGRLSGFIDRLGVTINELIEEAVEPDELSAIAESGSEESGKATLFDDLPARDPAQHAKLHDVALLYRAYHDYLSAERIDPSQYLQIARGVLAQCTWLHGAALWVDGFASFSGQERLTLLELTKLCAHVEITALLDPILLDAPSRTRSQSNRAAPPTPPPTDRFTAQRLFSRVHRTHQDLSRGLTESGIELDPPLLLEPTTPPRFARAPALVRMERSLFAVATRRNVLEHNSGETKETMNTGTRADVTVPTEISGSGCDTPIRIVELPDRRTEVDFAVTCIVNWVQASKHAHRYRDVAIIVRNLDLYHDLIAGALQSRGIPFFIDRRRPVVHHPLVELIRLAPVLISESMSLESMRLLLKTDLIGLPRDACDELENYLIAHGIKGLEQWQEGPWRHTSGSSIAPEDAEPNPTDEARLERIDAARTQVLGAVVPWLRFPEENPAPTGSAWTRAIIDWLQHLGLGATLRAWFTAAQEDGDLDAADEHEQVWKDAMALLDDLSFALEETPVTVRELADVLDAGLTGLTLGLVPPTIDQVLVGSIERSRHPDIKAAVIVGLNEGVFPAQPTEDAIFNDDDRMSLQKAGLRIGPPARERIVDEASLFYIALTRASESVVVTCASADEQGRSLKPSSYLDDLRAALGNLEIVEIGDARRDRSTWDILSAGDLRSRIVLELRTRPPLVHDDHEVRAQWNELYAWARMKLTDDPTWSRALSSLIEENRASLTAQSIEALHGGPLKTSVSRLETYAACPFQHFARYTLNLRERETAALQPIDMGHVHHAVLEEFVRDLVERDTDWNTLDTDAAMSILYESCDRVAQRLPDDARVSNARNAYLLRRSAAQLGRVLSAQRRSGAAGRARPRSTELAFGLAGPGALPALELTTPLGRRVFLRGYIDRVDLAEVSDELLGVVIDYKRTRNKRLDLSHVFHGLSPQLIVYLLVLKEHGETLAGRPIRPIGGFYVGLRSNYNVVDGPNDTESIEKAARTAHRPRGLIRFEDVEALDPAMAEAGWSNYYTIARTKEGKLGYADSGDGASGDQFNAVLEHTRFRLGELADGILDGEIAVRPYRLGKLSPCSWCAMIDVCRFEWGISSPRFLDPMKRSEVFTRLSMSQGDL